MKHRTVCTKCSLGLAGSRWLGNVSSFSFLGTRGISESGTGSRGSGGSGFKGGTGEILSLGVERGRNKMLERWNLPGRGGF